MRFLTNDQLQASFFNTGGLFFGGRTTSGDGYLIPKSARTQSPVFAAGLWIGGQVDAELRVAAARYGNWNFWPGPLEDATRPPQDCSEHDRIYVVSRLDLQRYYETGELTDDLRDWPHQLGAPVIDGDGNPDNYDLRAGDQPDLIGDQAAWWVMNDAGNEHPATGSTLPIGVEVRAHAFVYGYTRETASPALAQTTFIRYEILNRNAQTIHNLYVSLFADVDLGGAGDDYTGTDTLRNLNYVYNSDEEDSAYGIPPAWGIQVLDGFVGLANGRDDDYDGAIDEADEEMRMSTAPVYAKCCAGANDPGIAEEYYNMQRGLLPGGSPVLAYGHGLNGLFGGSNGDSTVFAFPADPVQGEFWSEVNSDGQGIKNSFGDRRMVLSTGPGRLQPGESVELLYAMPYGQGTDWLNSVTVLRRHASVLQAVHATGFFTSRPVEGRPAQPTYELALSRARPNPSRQPEVFLTLPEALHVRATVIDALGRQLAVVVDGDLPEGEHALAMPGGLAPGMYRLRVEVAPGAVQSLPFTIVR